MDKNKILEAVYDAVAEAYEIGAEGLNETSTCIDLPNHSSSKLLKLALFLGENLDQDDDLSFEEVAGCRNLGELADLAKEKYGL
mgnify:CR=1 FL=1